MIQTTVLVMAAAASLTLSSPAPEPRAMASIKDGPSVGAGRDCEAMYVMDVRVPRDGGTRLVMTKRKLICY